LATVTSHCQRCGAHGAYPDEGGTSHCLCCGRSVGQSVDGNHHLDPTKVYRLMSTPLVPIVSLRAEVAESLEIDI
jgi:hypothetical protein